MLAWNVFFSLHSGACESTCAYLFQCGVHFPCLCSVEENCALWQIHHHALTWIDIIDLIYPSLLILMLPLHFLFVRTFTHLTFTLYKHYRKIKCCLCVCHMCSQSEKCCHSCYVWMRQRTYFRMSWLHVLVYFVLVYLTIYEFILVLKLEI